LESEISPRQPEGETVSGRSGIIFQIGPKRKAALMVIEAFTERGLGVY
jgi:hypothetical protein